MCIRDSHTPVSDVRALASLSKLTEINLRGTQVSDISALASLANLTQVYLRDTRVRDVSAFASLSSLTFLDLRGTQVNDVTTIASLPNLRTIKFDGKIDYSRNLAGAGVCLQTNDDLGQAGVEQKETNDPSRSSQDRFSPTEPAAHPLQTGSNVGAVLESKNPDPESKIPKVAKSITNNNMFSAEEEIFSENKDKQFDPITQRSSVFFPSITVPILLKTNKSIETKITRFQHEQREGQAEFRATLLNNYKNKCALTGCDVIDVLDAAHIVPYSESYDHSECNGIILRTDLHRLFDRGMIGFDPHSGKLVLSNNLEQSTYKNLQNGSVFWPSDPKKRPSIENIKWHFCNIFRKFY